MSKNATSKKQSQKRAGFKLSKKQEQRREEVANLLGRFGRYLSYRRQMENLTIRAFALRAGMPYSNVYQLEQLRKNPRLSELALLAKAFQESLAEFLAPVINERPSSADYEAAEQPHAVSGSTAGNS